MIKKSFAILPIIFLLVFAAKADVAPELGYTRVNFDLILETKEDLSDYDFELDFQGDRRKITLNANSRTIFQPGNFGGGARYSSATLYATSKSSSERNRLFEHYFRRDVTLLQKLTYSPPVFLIERDGTKLKVTKSGDNYSYTPLIVIVFITLAILTLGVLLFRKSRKKSKIEV